MPSTLNVEYLFVSKLEDGLCTSPHELKNMLQSIKGIRISGNRIEYSGKRFDISITSGSAENGKSVHFNISISGSEEDIEELTSVTKMFRTIINKVTGEPPQTLWDDIGFYYCQASYPRINRIENLMRKLITKFMIINAGAGWHRINVPKEVDQSIKNRQTNDYLHTVDFIQLATLMFKEYGVTNNKPVIDKIRKSKEISELTLEELKQLSPLNNWDRYFSPIINSDADYIRTRWEKLYEYRNMVAHNKPIKKVDFDTINTLIDEVQPILEEALNKLNEISIPEEDQEEVMESAASAAGDLVMQFIRQYNVLTGMLWKLLVVRISDKKEEFFRFRHSLSALSREARRYKIINTEVFYILSNLARMRNQLVHESSKSFSDSEVELALKEAISLSFYIEKTTESLETMDKDGDMLELPF